MAEKMEQTQHTNISNDGRHLHHSPDFQTRNPIVSGGITRERSFVRTTNNQQNVNKRRSLAFNTSGNHQGQLRSKPAMDIYRPPNVRSDGSNVMKKLNVLAPEFTMLSNNRSRTSGDDLIVTRSSMVFPATTPAAVLSQAKSSAYFHPQMPSYIVTTNTANNRHTPNLQLRNVTMPNLTINKSQQQGGGHRSILVTHSQPLASTSIVASDVTPLMSSLSTGNVLHQNANRVKFAVEPQKYHHKATNIQTNNNNLNYNYQQQQQQQQYHLNNNINSILNVAASPYNMNSSLQRSKSLSSADALASGIAGLGLALGNDATDIGKFTPEIQALIDTALQDPNKLNSRCLMDLTSHFIKRAVEGRRYALPISRLCLNIIAKEQKETFLEALLNTCRQWYQEREKLLYTIQGMKSPSRTRFTSFLAFLTEMFCQLKRRQLQLRNKCEETSPPLILLTLLSKCCEDCVRPPVRSLSEIECLFYVLTCIGLDMETQLPQQLEVLRSLLRDAFLNSNESAPAIRRTLLQLIELQASHWQLPGNTVLYYYPSK